MKDMIKNNKGLLIVTSLVTLLPMVVGIMLWNRLPDTITTHWNMSGEADGFSSKAFAIFVPTLILFVAQWVCVWATACDKKNNEQSEKVVKLVLWIMPVVSVLVNSGMYIVALGIDFGIDLIARLLVSVIFMVLGNYMPKCRQNNTIGVKVVWTLRNEENWNKTHRFTGLLWTVGGLVLLVTIFVPVENIMFMFLAVIILMGFLPTLYSYMYYRKQLKSGVVSKEDMKATAEEKKWNKNSTAAIIIIVAGVAALFLTSNFDIEYNETSFIINANFWNDASVSYDMIDSIEYRNEDNTGVRTFGYGDFRMLMGEFKNSEFGAYTRYSHSSCDECVVITIDDKKLVINGENEQKTKEIYEQLMQRIQ